MPGPVSDALAVVVVTHQSAGDVAGLLATVEAQMLPDDQLVIVDNASSDGGPALARELSDRAAVVETGANLGFAGGCHVGADKTDAPLLLFLNPDCRPLDGCLTELRRAAAEHPGWGAWQATVMLDDRHVNSSGGVVHFLGIGWAGDCGRALADVAPLDRAVAFPSGAAMVVRRDAWRDLGGLDRDYFMYGEDLDLGLRLWLCGYAVGVAAAARVGHGYEFEKGEYKWFWLERNRWRTVLSVYPPALLVLLAPALLAAELALLVVAASDGWLRAKLRADASAIAGLGRTLRRRRTIQRARRVGAAEFAARLSCSLDSPYLVAADRPIVRLPQALYWRGVQALLGLAHA